MAQTRLDRDSPSPYIDPQPRKGWSVARRGAIAAGIVCALLVGVLAVVIVSNLSDTVGPPLTDAKIVFLRDIDGGYNTLVMDANGTHEHRTAGLPDEASICGQNIVYGEQTVNVLVLRAETTKLVTGPGENGRPKCSPDGSKIAFVSTRDGNREIYVMNSDGTNQQRVTSSPQVEGDIAWSPNGTDIAFARWVEGSRHVSDIYLIRTDGTNERQLTRGPGENKHPSWSPDGTRLAFQSSGSDDGGTSSISESDIYAMNVDGTDQRRLTFYPEQDTEPEWSPDGEAIVFSSGRKDGIYVMRPDGTELAKIGQGILPLWIPANHPLAEMPASDS